MANTNLRVEFRVGNYAPFFECGHEHRTWSGAVRCARRRLRIVSRDQSGHYRHRIAGVLNGKEIEPLDAASYLSGFGWEFPATAATAAGEEG